MNQKTTTVLITLVVVAIGILLLINTIGISNGVTGEKFISQNNVKGIEIEHNGTLYSLNFDQQKKMITLLNQSIKVGLDSIGESKDPSFKYHRVIIHQFDGPDLVMSPVGLINQQLLYRIREWNPNGLLRETGPGHLHTLLSETYDQ